MQRFWAAKERLAILERMPRDSVLTLKGNQVAISAVHLRPLKDGSVQMTVIGETKDGAGNTVQLRHASLSLAGVPVVDDLMTRALAELRRANALE